MTDRQLLEASSRRTPSRRQFLRSGLSAAAVVSAPFRSFPAPKTVSIRDFGAPGNDRSDTTPAVRAALNSGLQKLIFPRATYHFWPALAAESYVYASNNDAGQKRIAFPLFGMNDLDIDGDGSSFIFHGQINPFVIRDCRNLALSNFSIDWERPFHNEGKVLSTDANGICVEFDKQFPFKVDKDVLYFLGEDNQSCGIRGRDPCPIGPLLEFDPKRRETAPMVRDYYHLPFAEASSIGPNRVCLKEPKYTPQAGNIVEFGDPTRDYSAFSIAGSSGIELNNVTIHHAGGMGVVAQCSADLTLNQVKVTPSPGRVVSLTADATHFVNCRGKIVMSNSLFENQLDDATNIHGIYAQVTSRIAKKKLQCRLVHPQQRGVPFLAQGDRVEMLRSDDMITYAEAKIASLAPLNDEFFELELDMSVPDELKTGDAIGNITAFPDVTIRGCDIGRNRARGLLLGSRGKILIENNRFHTPGSAILMEGDARYWFEQAGVRDLTIRNNRFEDCNYGVWGKATIETGSGIDPAKRALSRYNRNISIEGNEFQVFDQGPLLSLYCVSGLRVANNRIEHDTTYTSQRPASTLYDIADSDNVHLPTS